MSTIRNPVGPQPPSVYWRRRLLVLLGVIAVIVVIVLIVVRPGAGAPGGTPAPSETPAPSVTPTPTSTSAASGEACDPSQIRIAAITDSNSYASGVKPKLSMSITNIGAAPCTLDVGTKEQQYIITSGSDRIWSSKDCQTDPTSTPILLEPEVEQTTTPFAWDRTRSSKETCDDSSRPDAVAGSDGPTYKLQVKLGDLESELTAFRLF